MRSRRQATALVVALALCAGCALPGGANSGVVEIESPKPSRHQAQSAAPDTTAAASQSSPNDVPPVGSGFPPLDSASRPNDVGFAQQNATLDPGPARQAGPTDDFAAFSRQLQGLSGLDPLERKALLDDLKQSDPALWPQLIRQFRSALAYRNRNASATVDSGAAQQSQTLDQEELPPSQTVIHLEPPATSFSEKKQSSRSQATVASVDATPGSAKKAATLPKTAANSDGVQQAVAVAAKNESPKLAAPAPGESTAADGCQLQLTKAILALESGNAAGSADAAEVNRQIQLRLLYLTAGRRDDALKPIAGLSAAQQEFWTKELYGLATYLDADRVADPERRATEAALHLREAAGRIGELATPVVRNLAFCKEVTSFGVYKKFPKYEFKAGDEVLLYSEIENLKAESTDRGYHSAVKSSYQILDSRGERIADQEFPASDDFCANLRRDFFVPYFIWLPKRINDGAYTLQLTVEDMQTKKIGQSSIQFTIK